MTDSDDSGLIAGIMRDLSRDEGFPAVKKIPGIHPVYVLDPRIVRREFEAGFRLGWDSKQALEELKEEEPDDTLPVKLGKAVLLGGDTNKKVLACYIESKDLVAERRAIYKCLGGQGLKGFRRKEHKSPPAPVAVLAQLAAPIHDLAMRREVTDLVEVALATHHATDITLGPPQVTLAS
jgi:hypothetical protein